MSMNKWIVAPVMWMLATGTCMAQPASIISQPDGAEMVLIPAGSFIYGADQKAIKALLKQLKAGWADIYGHEHRRQTKTLQAFYIDRDEVTNERYSAFAQATKREPSRFARYPQLNAPKQPVVGVGWGDAEAYCSWSGKRLPTEEEWEKAARGTDGRTWPWGNKADATVYNGKGAEFFAPVAAGSYRKSDSPYGVSDMAGNVWEMTSSQWQDGARVMRGGSFLNRLADVRVTVRWSAADEVRGANWLGFRCAQDAK